MKFIKTLILSVVALGTVAISSCTKDDDNGASASATITANIDGTATTFNKNVLGATSSVNGSTFTTIQGTDAAGNNLSITVAGVLTPGKTFTSNAAAEADRPIVIYTAASNESYVTGASDATDIVTVAVSSAASNTIQGSFNGKLTALITGNGVQTKTITDGKFNVTLNN